MEERFFCCVNSEGEKFAKIPCELGQIAWGLRFRGGVKYLQAYQVSEVRITTEKVRILFEKTQFYLEYDLFGNVIKNPWKIYFDKTKADIELKTLRERIRIE